MAMRRHASPPGNLQSGLSFRNLYTRVLLSIRGKERVVLGVTSAIAGEGKTTIAAGLATTLALEGAVLKEGRQGGTILLIECNQGLRSADRELAVGETPGLVQYLRGDCTLDAAIKPSAYERLAILPLGEPATGFPILIRNATLRETMAELRRRFDLIVLDLPAALVSTDTQVLAGFADHLLLVVRAGVTPAKLVQQALGELGEAQFLGVVLNDHRVELPGWLEQRL